MFLRICRNELLYWEERIMAKLSKNVLEQLQRIVREKMFDSDEAQNLDSAIMESLGTDVDYATFEPLNDAQAMFFASWWLEGEVNNGGFDQFFSNKGPVVAREAFKFCRERGLTQVAALLEKAIRAVGPEAMVDSDALQERLCEEDEALAERLNALDSAFFDLSPYPPFIEARLRYVIEHAPSFIK